MAKKNEEITKVTQSELISCTYSWYEDRIKEWEAKRNGDAKVDILIDGAIARFKKKLEVLEKMYEIECGTQMWAD